MCLLIGNNFHIVGCRELNKHCKTYYRDSSMSEFIPMFGGECQQQTNLLNSRQRGDVLLVVAIVCGRIITWIMAVFCKS